MGGVWGALFMAIAMILLGNEMTTASMDLFYFLGSFCLLRGRRSFGAAKRVSPATMSWSGLFPLFRLPGSTAPKKSSPGRREMGGHTLGLVLIVVASQTCVFAVDSISRNALGSLPIAYRLHVECFEDPRTANLLFLLAGVVEKVHYRK